MRTAHSSSRPGGGVSTRHPPGPDPHRDQATPRAGTPQDQAPPQSRHPPGPGTP